MTACTNANHDEIDCETANIPHRQRCENCRQMDDWQRRAAGDVLSVVFRERSDEEFEALLDEVYGKTSR